MSLFLAASLHLCSFCMKAFFALSFWMFLFGATAPAQAADVALRVLVSVGDLSPAKDLEWRKDLCTTVHQIGNQVVSQGVQISCRQDLINVIDTYLQQLKADNSYHIRILRGFKGSYRVSVSNWNRQFESDFGTLGWNIGREPHTKALRQEALQAVLMNFFSYLANETSLKSEWLLNARNHSRTISYDFKDLVFKSTRDRKKISVDTAIRLFEKESLENAEYLRSRQEMALAYAAVSPQGLNILNPEDTLMGILEKAAREGHKASLPWGQAISFDERGASKLTIDLIDGSEKEDLTLKDIIALPITLPKLLKKPLGKLIFLF